MRIHRALLATVACVAPFCADAALFRSYLSVNGNDANPCTLQAPCRLLPAALAAVDAGGEVWILDSANYNTATVVINKSVSVLAVPGVVGSVVAVSGDAILVEGTGAKVSLRNLVIRNLSAGQNGVTFLEGTQLAIDDCHIQGMPLMGVDVQAGNSKLVVRDTVIRDSGQSGIHLNFAVSAALDRVSILGAGLAGVSVNNLSQASITDTVVTGAITGVAVFSTNGGLTRAVIERSSVTASTSYGVQLNAGTGSGSRAEVVLRRSTIMRADTGIFAAATGTNTTASITLDQDVVASNRIGLLAAPSGGTVTLQTTGNNTLAFNTQADLAGSFTPIVPK